MREVLVLCAVYLAPGFGAAILPGTEAAIGNAYGMLATLRGAITAVAQHGSLALLTLYLFDTTKGGAPAEDCGARCWVRAGFAAAGIGAGLMGLAALFGAFRTADELGTVAAAAVAGPVVGAVVGLVAGAAPLWLSLIALLVVAYNEELFFRLYLMDRLPGLGASRTAAVTVAAALFALGHLYQGLLAFAFACCAGLLLGWLWTRPQQVGVAPRLHSFAWGHALYNAAAWLLWYRQFGIHIA